MRKLKFHSYINKQRHEDIILNELEGVYGKETIFVIGDWSNRGNLKGGIKTPNISIKRLLEKRFKVLLIDEYLTSKINYITDKQLEKNNGNFKIVR